MAFLTIIAPLVAMTYPIDKMNDGSAQAFNMWLKEYIFNLLIQPLHLVLYTILVSSAFELASSNIIYSLVALGFMIPAEKLMRRFFGFEKAQTPGLLAGPAGAAMVMSGMNKLLGRGSSGGKDGSDKSKNSEKDNSNVRTTEPFDTDSVLGNSLDTKDTKDDKDDKDKGKEIPIENATDDQLALLEGMEAYRKGDIESGDNYKYSGDRTDDERALLEGMEAYRNGDIESGDDYKYSGDMTDDERALLEGMEAYRNGDIKSGDDYKYSGDMTDDDRAHLEGMEANTNGDIESGGDSTYLVDENGDSEEGQIEKQIKDNSNDDSGRSLKRAVSRGAQFYARGMSNKISNKVKNAHLGRKVTRMAGGVAVGAVAGTIGLAAGIASGDPSKAFQYTTAGALAGYKTGSGTVNKAVNALSVEGFGDNFERNYYGEKEYKERQTQKAIKEKQKDLELQWKLEEALKDKKKAKEYMKNDLPEVMKYAEFDNKTIVAMAQMKEEKGYTRDETIAAALTSERDLGGKDYNSRSAKTKKEFEDTIKKRGQERKLDGDSLDKFVDRHVNAVRDLDKIRFK